MTEQATIEKEKVQQAWKEYERIQRSALEKYEHIESLAWKEYERNQRSAWKEYEHIQESAWEEYERIERLSQDGNCF